MSGGESKGGEEEEGGACGRLIFAQFAAKQNQMRHGKMYFSDARTCIGAQNERFRLVQMPGDSFLSPSTEPERSSSPLNLTE